MSIIFKLLYVSIENPIDILISISCKLYCIYLKLSLHQTLKYLVQHL